ncbi:MAG: hypothetical protein GY739_03065 [Mesoflavibacter sp.]|nr:hypothetical protein [Mesoflavibacter sp.]
MWSIENIRKSEKPVVLERTESYEKVRDFLESNREIDGKIYVFWESEFPQNKKDLKSIMQELFSLNNENDLRVFPNTKIEVNVNKPLCNCPTRCFCQWENGNCSCWTSICRPNGCYWVRCDGSCH